MKFYYSCNTPDSNGVTIIHTEGCVNLPQILSRTYLGIFPNENLAIATAKEKLKLDKLKCCICCADNNFI